MADEKEIEMLSQEVQSLRKALNELKKSFEIASQLASNYLKLVNVYAQYGDLSIDIMVPQVKHDYIAREIVRILFDLREANISQITRELKVRRGRASRNTVREKLRELVELGAVVEHENSREKTYSLSRELVARWLELIGIPINFEQP